MAERRLDSTAQGMTKRVDTAFRFGEAYATRVPLRFSLLAVLALLATTVAVFRIGYASNDDVTMTMIASGKAVCPAPDAHLVFTNVIVGEVLKRLYTIWPAFPWYGCYLLTVHWLAQAALLFCALTIGRPPIGALVCRQQTDPDVRLRFGFYLLYFVLVELPMLNRLQFTTTAFVAAQAGVFLWLLAWRRRAMRADAPIVGPLGAAVALLVLSGLIRWESLLMAVLVAVPACLVFLVQPARRAIVPCGAAMVVAAMLVAAAFAYDRSTYELDPNWHGYRHLHQIRRMFHDLQWTSFTPETAHAFSQVGWSENDHAMIAKWYCDDPVLYSEANLTRILDAHPWDAARRNADLWRDSLRAIARHRAVLSALIVLPFVLFTVPGKRAKWAVAVTLPAALSLLVLVIWYQKVPAERVFFSLLSFPLSIALLSFAWRDDQYGALEQHKASPGHRPFALIPWTWQSGRLRASIVFGCLVTAIIMGVLHQVRQTTKIQRARVALHRFLDEMHPDGTKLFVCFEAAIPYEVLSPLDNLHAWSRIPLLSLLWTQGTPWHEDLKQRFGISNLAQALCVRDDVVLIAKPPHVEIFTTFAKEHFGADVKFVASQEVANTFLAGSFASRVATPNTARKSTPAAPR